MLFSNSNEIVDLITVRRADGNVTTTCGVQGQTSRMKPSHVLVFDILFYQLAEPEPWTVDRNCWRNALEWEKEILPLFKAKHLRLSVYQRRMVL